MSSEQLVQRLIAQETGIDTQRMRSGKLADDDWPLFVQAIDVLSQTHIWLDDTPGITPLQLRTKCRRMHLEHHLDLILLDYIQLMSGDTRTDNRVQEVSYISRNLKQLARELNVPVLAAAQLSRAVEQRQDKRPQLSDLRESGSLEQDSDIVMFIHRPDALEKDSPRQNIAEIIVAKHRNGPTHPGIELVFLNNLARFDTPPLPRAGEEGGMPFSGFPAGKVHLTPIPAPFCRVAAQDRSPGRVETKPIRLWFLDRLEGEFRYLTLEDLSADEIFMSGMEQTMKPRWLR